MLLPIASPGSSLNLPGTAVDDTRFPRRLWVPSGRCIYGQSEPYDFHGQAIEQSQIWETAHELRLGK